MKIKKKVLLLCLMLLALLNLTQVQSYFFDNVWLKIDGSGLDGADQKCYILVQVPYDGGYAINYIVLEVLGKEDLVLHETGTNIEGHLDIQLELMDYLIIVASDSDGDNNWDDFSLHIKTYDSGYTFSSVSYHFGDNGNDLKLVVFQLENRPYFKVTKSTRAFSIAQDGGMDALNGHTISEWESIRQYLSAYWTSGNEQVVEDLIHNFYFPAPKY